MRIQGILGLLCKSIEYCMPWMLVSYQGRCYSLGLSHWKTPGPEASNTWILPDGWKVWSTDLVGKSHIWRSSHQGPCGGSCGTCWKMFPKSSGCRLPRAQNWMKGGKAVTNFSFLKVLPFVPLTPRFECSCAVRIEGFLKVSVGITSFLAYGSWCFLFQIPGKFLSICIEISLPWLRRKSSSSIVFTHFRWLFGFGFPFFHLSNGCPQLWWYSRHDLGLLPLSWTTAWRLPPGGGVESVLWLSETVNVRSDGKERYSPQMNWLRILLVFCACCEILCHNFWAAYDWTKSSTYTSSYIFPSASCQERLCGQDVCNATALALAVYARALLLWSLGGRRHLSQDCWILGSIVIRNRWACLF